MAGEDPTKVILPIFDVRIAETENHRLMIETSRYLTNADIIDRLESKGYDSDLIDDIKEDQDEVRVWLLQRLQDITKNDFIEYNARPYTRYSLEAILNLYDFADVHGDHQMHVAAGIVLDLSVAKFAVGSNRGRRLAPYRRRSENDGSDPGANQDLYNYASGADHEVARALVLGGQTQLLPYGWLAEKGGVGVLVNTAVTT